MIDNFERLHNGVYSIYRNIQKIKKSEMNIFGLSGKHVMPFYYLLAYPDGLTSSQLCKLCKADKAGVSRALSEMEKEGYLLFEDSADKKRYRTRIFLTDKGKEKAKQIRRIIWQMTLESGQEITEEDREVFYRVLDLISHNLDRICSQEE